MADLEKVLKGLECCCSMTGEACRQCPYDEECAKMIGSGSAHLCSDAMELLKEQPKQRFFVDSDGKITPLPIQPQWIRVEDRLPENSDTVLITHKGGVSFGWYNGRYWERGASTKHREIRTVSHWMPLPKAPEVIWDD